MDHVLDAVDHVQVDAPADVPEMVVVHVIIAINVAQQLVLRVTQDVLQWA